ncbi:hypothetical protein H6P81_009699 [Aristolochia fimbriata]|uniref:Uncharacterized protein n=1 Tax=Aristolochia fimbriata TaxID=158543 RepID=A0AAV7EM82_ARIFI|nr:hypothetical protein H6P81_009699 [Aristolochia fimbriata]
MPPYHRQYATVSAITRYRYRKSNSQQWYRYGNNVRYIGLIAGTGNSQSLPFFSVDRVDDGPGTYDFEQDDAGLHIGLLRELQPPP